MSKQTKLTDQRGKSIKRYWAKLVMVIGAVMFVLQAPAFNMFILEEAVQANGFGFMPAWQVRNATLVLQVYESQVVLIGRAEAYTESWGRLAFWAVEPYRAFFKASRTTAETYRILAQAKLKEEQEKPQTETKKVEVYQPKQGDILVSAWLMDEEYAHIVEMLKLDKVQLMDGKYYMLTGKAKIVGESQSGKSWKVEFQGLGASIWLTKTYVVKT